MWTFQAAVHYIISKFISDWGQLVFDISCLFSNWFSQKIQREKERSGKAGSRSWTRSTDSFCLPGSWAIQLSYSCYTRLISGGLTHSLVQFPDFFEGSWKRYLWILLQGWQGWPILFWYSLLWHDLLIYKLSVIVLLH